MTPQNNRSARPLWPLVVVGVCAVGAGITGTLWWQQHNAPVASANAPASAVVSPVPADLPPLVGNLPKPAAPAVAQPVPLPQDAPNPDTPPPPNLTAGLTPPQAALMRGNWFFDHSNWPRAITEYQSAIQGGIDNPNVRTDLGSAFRFAKQPQKALEQYQIAQKQDPNHENSLFNQAGLYAFSLGQTAKGVEIWNAYLKRFPNGKNAVAARQLLEQAKKGEKMKAQE